MSKEFGSHPNIYPERPGTNIDEALKTLESKPEIILSPEEKGAVLEVERLLTVSSDLNQERFPEGFGEYSLFQTGDENVVGIEQSWRISIESRSFFTDYFLTDEGYNNLKNVLGYTGAQEVGLIEKFLASGEYFSKKIEDVDHVVGMSRDYAISHMVDQFEQSNFDNPDAVSNPATVTAVMNPEDLITKLKGYTQLKHYLKRLGDSFDVESPSGFEQAIDVVIQMHMRRLNELTADLYPTVASFIEQASVADDSKHDELLDSLKGILQGHRYDMLVHIANARAGVNVTHYTRKDLGDRLFERLDKFINGVGVMRDHEYTVISEQAKNLSESSVDQSLDTSQEALFSTVDKDKFTSVKVNALTMQSWAKKVLDEYGLLSSENEESYHSTRQGRAQDGKWQVVIDPKVKVLSVNSRKGIMTIPKTFNRSIASLTPTGAVAVLDHEIRHILQHVNKQKFGLAITDHVGMDRSSIYKEAGAIEWESDTQAKLFGLPRDTNTHYLRAVQARYKGGTLAHCAKAFFDSYIQQNPDLEKDKAMELAIDRAMRIFRKGGVYKSARHHISNSAPLVYMEQEILAQKLRGTSAVKLLSIADVNIEMLAKLYRVGLIDIADVHNPPQKPSDIILPEVKELLGVGDQ